MSDIGMEILARIKAKAEKSASDLDQSNDVLSPTGVNLNNLNKKNNETLSSFSKDTDKGM